MTAPSRALRSGSGRGCEDRHPAVAWERRGKGPRGTVLRTRCGGSDGECRGAEPPAGGTGVSPVARFITPSRLERGRGDGRNDGGASTFAQGRSEVLRRSPWLGRGKGRKV